MEKIKKNPYATNKGGAIGPLFKDGDQTASTVIRAQSDLRAGGGKKNTPKKGA